MRHRLLVGAIALVATVVVVVPSAAQTDLPAAQDLEEVKERREAVEERLATEAGDVEGLEQEIAAIEAEVAELESQEERLLADAGAADERMAQRARQAFMHGDPNTLDVLLEGGDVNEVTQRAALLQSLSLDDRAAAEEAIATSTALAANRDRRAAALDELDTKRAGLQEQVDLLLADLDQLAEDEARFEEELAAQREEARRQREAEQRRQREAEAAARAEEEAAASAEEAAPAPQDDGSSAPAPVSGGLACPVGDPVVFSDTWGAPRSGGRSHQGVDMMAPHGTPVYAITSGRITRMNSSGLGGISLYMFGDDGNEYFYTHLQGYASGVGVGDRVGAGDLVAYNGSTGNASSSAPHVHFEVHPGGGGAVNPYPYAARACGR